MSATTGDMIGDAVHENQAALSSDGLMDRTFAKLFQGLVYAQIWEDPVCDMVALDLGPDDHIVCIASGGCNMMSYLTASPASITVVDLSPWHVKLNRLKLAAARHLPDHAAFYDLFGHANRPGAIYAFDRHIAPHLTEDERGYWNERVPFRRRKTKLARGFHRFGVLGRFLGTMQFVCRVSGVRFDELLNAKSLDEQVAFFDRNLAPLFETRLVRFAARRRASLFGLGIPPAQYEKLAADAEGDVIPVLKERTRKLFCDFPIAENYFAWQAATRGYDPSGQGSVPPYLEAHHFDTVRQAASRVSVHNRSVTDMLADQPAASKSAYVLLDAQDWMTDAQLTALWDQITRTAKPGARVLFRTGGAPDILPGRVPDEIMDRWTYDTDASATAFQTDRSAIYGGVHLYRFKG